MMPALAAQRRGCRGLYRLYLRCQAAPRPRACHGESCGAGPLLRAGRGPWGAVPELRARPGHCGCRRSQAVVAAGVLSEAVAPLPAAHSRGPGPAGSPGCSLMLGCKGKENVQVFASPVPGRGVLGRAVPAPSLT